MSRPVEDRIASVAAAQHGVVTRAQATEAGLTPCMVERRLASGRLRLLHRGVYLVLPFPLPRTREMAAVLASGPGALLSLFNAASLWELRPAIDGPVHVIVPGHRGHRPGIHAHRVRPLAEDERTVRDSIPVTTAARTLLDLASVPPLGSSRPLSLGRSGRATSHPRRCRLFWRGTQVTRGHPR